MSTDRPTQSDKELWRSLATGPNIATGPVSDVDFAAWLEGRLSEADAVRIEAAVAANPEMRRAALELADVLGQPLPAPPARLEVRAKALVGFEVERTVNRDSLFGWLFSGRRFDLARSAALTAAVVIAISGFMLGGGLGESLARERYASVNSTTDTANELTEFLTSDGL
jgi:anti-sigma factor RsiW